MLLPTKSTDYYLQRKRLFPVILQEIQYLLIKFSILPAGSDATPTNCTYELGGRVGTTATGDYLELTPFYG